MYLSPIPKSCAAPEFSGRGGLPWRFRDRFLGFLIAAAMVLFALSPSPATAAEKKELEGRPAAVAGTVAQKQEARQVNFSGQTWRVKNGRRFGPGPNAWANSPKNVWLDDQGQLHLAIVPSGDRWDCAEVVATRSLGYGEYRWVIAGNLSKFDPRVVLGLFLYENDQREIDFELSRWAERKTRMHNSWSSPAPRTACIALTPGKPRSLPSACSGRKRRSAVVAGQGLTQPSLLWPTGNTLGRKSLRQARSGSMSICGSIRALRPRTRPCRRS